VDVTVHVSSSLQRRLVGTFLNIARIDHVMQVGCNAKLQGQMRMVGMVTNRSAPCPLRHAGRTVIPMCKRRCKPTVVVWKHLWTPSTRKGIYNVVFSAVAVKTAHRCNDHKVLTIS
jgi:hypothetical protein